MSIKMSRDSNWNPHTPARPIASDQCRMEAEEALEQIRASSAELFRAISENGQLLEEACLVLPMSRFVARSMAMMPGPFLEAIKREGRIPLPLDTPGLKEHFSSILAPIGDKDRFFCEIRRLKRFHAASIAWNDLAGRLTVLQVLEAMTALAEAAMESALSFSLRKISEGRLPKAKILGTESTLCVLGMGKLGGRELNFSSDVDFMFCFEPTGQLSGHAAEELYTRSARLFISALNLNTQDGYVFRTDTRLRPFGEGGPLVLSTDAMEEYYQNHGRQWERYALIKARPVAGRLKSGHDLIDALRPFVYRRYLDYSTIESLREIKLMIEDELRKKGLRQNIKLGPGGIREIEFIVQTFQLIKGGRLPALRTPSLLAALDTIAELELIPHEQASFLSGAYLFLRAVENRLQEYDDQQTHILPDQEDRRRHLALSMGFNSWEGLSRELARLRGGIHEIFSDLFAEKGRAIQKGAGADEEERAKDVWRSPESQTAPEILAGLGYEKAAEAAELISSFRSSRRLKTLSEQAERLLDRLMPMVITACARSHDQLKALKGLFQIIEAVLTRTSYLSLLLEYPQVLRTLVDLSAKSQLICRILSRQPILLDELVDPVRLREPLTREILERQLNQLLSSIAKSDEERRLDELRLFKKAGLLKTAAADLEGIIEVDQVGRQLTELAEVLLTRCLKEAEEKIISSVGAKQTPFKGPDHTARLPSSLMEAAGLCVVALGKAGSREMGYTSDLDLIFLYDMQRQEDLEALKISKAELNYLLTRLVHRLIHLLTTRTSQGILYEIDTRLRPDGAQGLLVSSLDSFLEYQLKKAWIWEHQALIRGRFIAGSTRTGALFGQVRQRVLGIERDEGELREQIANMRARLIEAQNGIKGKGLHLKRGPGSILDIEFITQYLTLAHAHKAPDLLQFTSTTDLLVAMDGAGIMEHHLSQTLCQAFRAFRKELGRLSLDLEPPITQKPELIELQGEVLRAWEHIFG